MKTGSADTPPIGLCMVSNGWSATAQFDFDPWLAVAGDFDGTYTDQGANVSGWLES